MPTLADRCDDLACGGTHSQEAAWEFLFQERGHWLACRTAAAEEDPGALAAAWQDLRSGRALTFVTGKVGDAAGGLLAGARRLVGAAEVAARVRAPAEAWDPARVLEAAWRAATDTRDPLPEGPALPTSVVSNEEPGQLVARAFEALAPHAGTAPGFPAARAAAVRLLPKDPVLRALRQVPLLVMNDGGGGVARLTLELVPHAGHALLPTPWLQLETGGIWAAALSAVWEGLAAGFQSGHRGCAVLWEVETGEGGIDGNSAAAALRIALELLRDDEPWDVSCAVSASLDGDRLAGVHGIAKPNGTPDEKLAAAQQAGIRRVIVAPADFAALTNRSELGLKVVSCKTVDDARREVSGQATGLRDYYRRLVKAPAEQLLPQGWGPHSLANLYVEPEVLRVEPRDGGSEPGASGGFRPHVAPEARDSGERLFGMHWEQAGPTLPVSRILKDVKKRDADPPARVVVLGPPGQGKSLLAAMTARELAAERLEALAAGLADHDAVLLVRLPEVIKALENGVEPADAAARLAFGAKRDGGAERNRDRQGADGETKDRLAAEFLAECLRAGRAVLLLDALDEVAVGEQETHDRLRRFMESVRAWGCRVVVLSRPYGYDRAVLNLEGVTEYRMAEFSRQKAGAFVEKWFFREREARDRALRLLDLSPSVRRIRQNPFLLTLFCAVANQGPVSEEISEEIRRTELYQRAIELALGGRDWLPLMEEIGWRMLRRDAAWPRISDDELLRLLWEGDEVNFAAQQRAVGRRDNLARETRILVPAAAGKEYVFPHRSFADFLAAAYLARTANRAEQEGINGWETPLIPVPRQWRSP